MTLFEIEQKKKKNENDQNVHQEEYGSVKCSTVVQWALWKWINESYIYHHESASQTQFWAKKVTLQSLQYDAIYIKCLRI